MAFSFTSDDLVSSVKVRGRVPTSQTMFTTTRILKIADEELEIGLLPAIMKVRESYYLRESDVTVVANQSNYRIPDRAIGGKLRGVSLINANGYEIPLRKIEYEDRVFFTNTSPQNPVFYIKNNSIVLAPTPINVLGTLRFAHFVRPSTLVLVSSCAKVTAIDTTAKTVTVASLPSTISTLTLTDIVKGSGGYDCLQFDTLPISITGPVIGFSTLPTDLSIGDYVCVAGETPIPQIPAELNTVLALRVTVTILASLGFVTEMKVIQTKLEEAEHAIQHLISPRVDGSAKKIVNRNSILNTRRS